MKLDELSSILGNHIPPPALAYCKQLYQSYGFDFRLRKSRITKIGDFTFRPGSTPRITVNQDLDPFMFLVTYLHEIAHLEVQRTFGSRVEAHGIQWKNAFKQIIDPVLNESIFPTDLLTALRKHMSDPMATTFSDPELMKVFRNHDPKATAQLFLADIPEGSVFGLRGRWFKKGKTKRTRVLCQELKSKRKYLVPADAAVENVQLSLL